MHGAFPRSQGLHVLFHVTKIEKKDTHAFLFIDTNEDPHYSENLSNLPKVNPACTQEIQHSESGSLSPQSIASSTSLSKAI